MTQFEGTPLSQVSPDAFIGMLRVQLAEVCPWGLGVPNLFSLTLEELSQRLDLYEGHEPCICGDKVGMYSRALPTIENLNNEFAARLHLVDHPEEVDHTFFVETELPSWTHRSVFVLLGEDREG